MPIECGKAAMEAPDHKGPRWMPCRRALGHDGPCAHEPSHPADRRDEDRLEDELESVKVQYLRAELEAARSDASRWAARVRLLEDRSRRALAALEGRS